MLAFLSEPCYDVQVVSESDRHAAVAQLDRVTGYEPVGQGFESLLPCQHRSLWLPVLFFLSKRKGRTAMGSPPFFFIWVRAEE